MSAAVLDHDLSAESEARWADAILLGRTFVGDTTRAAFVQCYIALETAKRALAGRHLTPLEANILWSIARQRFGHVSTPALAPEPVVATSAGPVITSVGHGIVNVAELQRHLASIIPSAVPASRAQQRRYRDRGAE